MTPEQQRVAIAEACGLTNVAPMIVKNVKHEGDDITVGIWSDDGWVPQYLNDLNAMQSSVQSQSERFQDDFDGALKNSGKWVASMTAQEWADIFILCLQSQRELNAANVEIEEKRKDVVWLATEKAKLEERIKRLEEAGDALANTQTYDLLETVNWRKSKEAKP